jgi:glutathione S-transferase
MPVPVLVIGNKAYSSWSLRPWVFMKHHGLAFDEVRVALYCSGYKEKLLCFTPAGKVPALIDGELRIWDSLSILEYLAERYPATRGWPADAATRAHARSISAEMHSGFVAMRQNLPMNVRRTYAPRDWDGEVAADIARIAAIWEDCRRRFGAQGTFLFGEFSIADAMFAPVAWRFHTYAVSVSPLAQTYREALIELPAMQQWFKQACAETEVIERFECQTP